MSDTSPRQPRLTTVALANARRGWPVFPLQPGSKIPAVEDWNGWATLDPRQIIDTWATRPFNVAIATGAANLVVIDLDDTHHNGATGLDPGEATHGLHVLTELARAIGERFPSGTFTVSTPGNGLHLYYRQPTTGPRLRNTAGRLGPLIDSRADGGYIVSAGSTIDGRFYTAVNRAPVLVLPPWIATRLVPPPPTPVTPVRLAAGSATSYAMAALDSEAARVHAAPTGQRRLALLTAASRMGRIQDLDEATITGQLRHACRHHLADGAFTEAERDRAISDGIAWGRAHPREITRQVG